jgi:hypothetical protein
VFSINIFSIKQHLQVSTIILYTLCYNLRTYNKMWATAIKPKVYCITDDYFCFGIDSIAKDISDYGFWDSYITIGYINVANKNIIIGLANILKRSFNRVVYINNMYNTSASHYWYKALCHQRPIRPASRSSL